MSLKSVHAGPSIAPRPLPPSPDCRFATLKSHIRKVLSSRLIAAIRFSRSFLDSRASVRLGMALAQWPKSKTSPKKPAPKKEEELAQQPLGPAVVGSVATFLSRFEALEKSK